MKFFGEVITMVIRFASEIIKGIKGKRSIGGTLVDLPIFLDN